MTSWPELRELTRIRVLAFLRAPEAVFWVFVFPVALALVLGLAFRSSEPAPSKVGVLAETSPTVVSRLEGSGGLDVERFDGLAAAERALFAGRIDVLLPGDADGTLRRDPARAEAELAEARVRLALMPPDGPQLTVDPVTEKGSRYIDFLLPGLLGMNLMGTGIWSIAFAIADLRQKKVLKRLLVTPMRRSSFLASLGLARLVFLVFEVLVITAFAVWAMDVPLRGGLISYSLICLVGASAFAGLGVLAAARVRTIEGASGMINLIMMPMWLGSGVFFSYERFPEWSHGALRLLPLTALNDALRRCMLEGAGLTQLATELAILVTWTLGTFALALRVFRWD